MENTNLLTTDSADEVLVPPVDQNMSKHKLKKGQLMPKHKLIQTYLVGEVAVLRRQKEAATDENLASTAFSARLHSYTAYENPLMDDPFINDE